MSAGRCPFHRGDLGRAETAARPAALDIAGRSPGYRMTLAAWPRALILEAGGEHAQALATMADAWDTCARRGLVLEYPAVGADLVRLALAAGDTGRARNASAAVRDLASRNDVPWMTGAALHCRGLIEDSAETLQAAAGAYARGSRPLQLALAVTRKPEPAADRALRETRPDQPWRTFQRGFRLFTTNTRRPRRTTTDPLFCFRALSEFLTFIAYRPISLACQLLLPHGHSRHCHPGIVGPATVGPATVGPATVGPATVGPATVGPATAGDDNHFHVRKIPAPWPVPSRRP